MCGYQPTHVRVKIEDLFLLFLISCFIVSFMAFFNFLTGSMNGTVGDTVFYTKNGITFARYKSSNVTNRSDSQNKAYTAFSELAHFCSYLARKIGYLLQRDNSFQSLYHNLLHSFKGMISDHVFDFRKISNVLSDNFTYPIIDLTFDYSRNTMWVKTNSQATNIIWKSGKYLFLFAKKNGECFAYLLCPNFDGNGCFQIQGVVEKADFIIIIEIKQENGLNLLAAGKGFYMIGSSYSLLEKLTDNFWIDGRPIYRKTFHFEDIEFPDEGFTFPHGITSFRNLISYEAIYNDGAAHPLPFINISYDRDEQIVTDIFSIAITTVSPSTVSVNVMTQDQTEGSLDISLYYTKNSDAPSG